MPYTHIKWDREARAYECACGYLQGERDAVAAQAHEEEYHRIAKEVQGTIGLPIAGIWPSQLIEQAKPGDIATWNPKDGSVVFHKPTYGGLPVVLDSAVPQGTGYLVAKNDFDNAGRHISDIAREAVANADRAEGFASNAWEAAAFARLQQQLAKAARPHYKTKRKWYYLWLK